MPSLPNWSQGSRDAFSSELKSESTHIEETCWMMKVKLGLDTIRMEVSCDG